MTATEIADRGTAEPLVATPDDDTDWYAGAGFVESGAQAIEEVGSGDATSIAVKGVIAGIDALGVLTDPFGSLTSAGVGWAIEHISFLREPLDALAGDPDAIKAHAKTWANVSKHLKVVAGDGAAALDGVSGWEGAAADAYRARAREWTSAIAAAGVEAARLANETMDTAASQATVRSIIRDAIADFVGGLIGPLLAAAAASVVTVGTSLVAFVAMVVAKAITLARRFAHLIEKLLDTLGLASQRLTDLIQRLGELAQKATTVKAVAWQLRPDFGRWMGANPSGLPQPVVAAEKKLGSKKVGSTLTDFDESVQAEQEKKEMAG
ncbi:hypothetical protein [Pseudonocardia sp. N23]|uniref:hypothetical protein n=1 Tax=Pseudonocardia sp. N23 TaxID=1987376 RepID=UPI000BFDB67A|nr:hypothetical protein [Pseudonocardia sp. N23]GAY11034.1 hypothetical protein TOK_5519 [Pseudonocardia sp. N23]